MPVGTASWFDNVYSPGGAILAVCFEYDVRRGW
jgi:hypothetical protein